MKRFSAEAASYKFPLLTSLLIVGAAVMVSARADITGFNNGVNFTLNSPDGGGSISGDTATLTNNQTFEATSVYYDTPQSISAGFQASFTYQATGGNSFALADGMTFVLQNAGLNAVGGTGGGLGYSGIAPSAAVALDIWTPFEGTALATNGNIGSFTSTSPVNLDSTDPIAVLLSYNGTTNVLTETLKDTVTSATFSTSYTSDLASVLGASTALVGFTGGTGAGSSTQTVSNFTFASIPEPTSMTLWASSVLMMAAYGCWARQSRKHVA
jgi:Bacterial lectin